MRRHIAKGNPKKVPPRKTREGLRAVTVRRESAAKAVLKKATPAKAKHGAAKASQGPRKQVHRTAFLQQNIWHGGKVMGPRKAMSLFQGSLVDCVWETKKTSPHVKSVRLSQTHGVDVQYPSLQPSACNVDMCWLGPGQWQSQRMLGLPFCLAVRTLTFCQLLGFPLNH